MIQTIPNITVTYGSEPSIIYPTTNNTDLDKIYTFVSSDENHVTIENTNTLIYNNGNEIPTIITVNLSETNNYTSASTTFSVRILPAITNYPNGFTISTEVYELDKLININEPFSENPGIFTYEINSGSDTLIAEIIGNKLKIKKAGTTVIKAIETGNLNWQPGYILTSFTVSKAIPSIGSLTLPIKKFTDEPYTIINPTSPNDHTGLWAYESSNTEVAVINGNIISYVNTGTVTITATLLEDTNYLSKSIDVSFTIIKGNPTVGQFIIPNKTINDNTYTIINPTKPQNHTGLWSYISENPDKATISGNEITFINPGTVKIRATLASDNNYNSKSLTTLFSISETNIASSFNFVNTQLITNLIPSNIVPINNILTLLNNIFTTEIIQQINPNSGTFNEASPNKNLFIDILFDIYSDINIIQVPKEIIYIPPQLKNPITEFNLFNSKQTNIQTPLIIETSNIAQTNGIYCLLDNFENTVRFNGSGIHQGFSLKIIKDIGNNFTVIKINNQNITTQYTAITGDLVYYAGLKLVLGSITGQLFEPISPTIGELILPTNKKYLNEPFTLQQPISNNPDGTWTYYISDLNGNEIHNSTIASISGNMVTILSAGQVYITAYQSNTDEFTSGYTTSLLTIGKATPTLGQLVLPSANQKKYLDEPFTLTPPLSNNYDSGNTWTYYVSDITGNIINDTSKVSISGNTVTIEGAGSVYITALQAETANFIAYNTTSLLTIDKAIPTILTDLVLPTNKKYLDNSFELTNPVTNNEDSGNTWSYIVTNSFNSANQSVLNNEIITINNNVVTIHASGTVTITAIQAATSNFYSISTSKILNISKAEPTFGSLVIPTGKKYLDNSFELTNPESNNNETGNNWSYSVSNSLNMYSNSVSNTNVITILNNTVNITGAGTALITATQAETLNFFSKSISEYISIGRKTGTINSISNISTNYGSNPVTINYITNNTDNYSFSFTTTSQIINITQNVISFLDDGNARVDVSISETNNYTEATTWFTVTVLPINPNLGIFNINTVTYSSIETIKVPLVAPTSTNIDGTWSFQITDINGISTESSVAYINNLNELVVTGAGYTYVKAIQQSIYGFNEISTITIFNVNKAYPLYGDFILYNKTYLDQPFTLINPNTYSDGQWVYNLSDISGNITNDTSVISITENIATITGAGAVYIKAMQLATNNFTEAFIVKPITINKAISTLNNLILPNNKKYLDVPFELTPPVSNNYDNNNNWLYYASDINGNQLINDSTVTINDNIVTINKAGSVYITAFQNDTNNFYSNYTTSLLTIGKATPQLGSFILQNKEFLNEPFIIEPPISNNPSNIWIFEILDSKDLENNVVSNDNVISINNNTRTVTIINTGYVTIKARQIETSNFFEESKTAILTINRITPSIINDLTLPTGKTFLDDDFNIIDPITSSNGNWSYFVTNFNGVLTNDTSVIDINNNTVIINAAGNVFIKGVQEQTRNYFNISIIKPLQIMFKIDPTIGSFILPTNKVYGNAPFLITNPVSDSPGLWSYVVTNVNGIPTNNTSVVSINGNIVTINGFGSVYIKGTQQDIGIYKEISVIKPIIISDNTLNNPSDIKTIDDLNYFINNTTATNGTISNNITGVRKLVNNKSKSLIFKQKNKNVKLTY